MEREDFLSRFPARALPEEPPRVSAWEGGAEPAAFLDGLRAAGGEAVPAGPEDWVETVLAVARRWEVGRAVASAEPRLRPAVEGLRRAGVEVAEASREAAMRADLGLTGARWGLASTGTVVLVSSPEAPLTASLLPAAHLAVVGEEDLLADLAGLARAVGREGIPPRSITLITGPSRTADIEQTLVVGAHGPARMGAVLVAGSL